MPTRPCWVEIRTQALEANYRFLKSLAGPQTECLAIVKADAYGHGLPICAPAAVRAGARWLGVTSVEEAVAARAVSPNARILVMGGIFPGQGPAVVQHALTAVIWDLAQLDELESAARAAGIAPASLPVHLEIDTGMSRQGANLDQIASLVARFQGDSPLRLEAVMTHLYASDEAGGMKTGAQMAVLEQALQRVQAEAHPTNRPEWLSAGATAALLGGDARSLTALAGRFGLKPMLRLGLALYGVAPRFNPQFEAGGEPASYTSAQIHLKPVLTWKTRITSLRSVAEGTEIGYNGTFVATEPMRLALLPLGYADGIDRRLGNRFNLLVRGQRVALVGRISMDQAVIDVTELADVEPGEEVVILGTQGDETISAYEHAEASGTIPWEIFTRIAPRVTRVELPAKNL